MIFSRGSFFCIAAIILSFYLSGCATIAGSFNPQIVADQLAHDSMFIKESIPTSVFNLTAYKRLKNLGKPLTVYIEGDGRAWLSKNEIANDPTPFHPMVLEMASIDPSPNVVYLARPCQYGGSASEKPCGPEYWSNKRFSEEVIVSMNEAIDQLKHAADAKEIHLVGYSGGAAVAVLVAARRNDVVSLRTIAGNLDPEAVNRYHKVDSLAGSLNPMDVAAKLFNLPQRHFIGADDKTVPPFISQNFKQKIGRSKCIQLIEYKGVTHYKGWKKHWPDILKLPVDCHE